MGGSSKKQTVGHKYYLGVHMAMPMLDRLLRIVVGGKEAWIGNRESGRINIDQGGLFGGESREGGISGALDFLPGRPEQGQNDYLISQLGSDIPAFRGVSSIVLRQMYIGMNPYLKNWEFRGQRIHTTTDGRPQWYPEKAEIIVDSPFQEDQFFYFVLDQSGSMGESVGGGQTRMDVMKVNMLKALDEIDRLRIDSKVSVSIGISSFSTSSIKTSRSNVDSGDIAYLKNWVSALVEGGVTNFNAGIQPAEAWFKSETLHARPTGYDPHTFEPIAWEYTSKPGRRVCFFITDGEPNPESSAAEAVATASDMLDRSSGLFNDQDGTQVEMYGMNIDLQNTSWTKLLDNTPRDGVPVVSGGDSSALWDAIYFAAMGPSSAMNPAHIVRECITDPDWGMGHPEADLNATSFTACADVLHAERFGLSLLWDQQQPLEDFIQLVLNHIDGHLYVEPSTGLWTLKLVRDDYDAAALLVLDESNVSRIEDASWPAFGERVNSITVQYWDVHTGNDDSISVQDIALAQLQGTEINTTIQYPGIPTGELASRVAARDMRALSTPLLSCTLYAYREAESLRLGEPFRLVWPDYGIGDMIMRVVEIAYGDSHHHGVRIKAVQDVFALPTAVLTAPAPIEWEAPNTTPAPVPAQIVLELPYYELVQRFGEREVDRALQDNPELGYLGVAAAAPSGAAVNAVVATDSGAGWEETAVLDFCPLAVLDADIGYLDDVIPIVGGVNLDAVEVGTHAQIDDELVAIDAVSATELTIRRGVLDTVPARHTKGATILFWDAFVESNETEYVLGDTVDVKVLPVTGSGQLPLEAAPTGTVGMNQRALRPYPPGDVKINGLRFPSAQSGDLLITWVHRNRLQQSTPDLLDFLSPGLVPEPGVTYRLIATDPTDSVIYEAADIDDTEYTVPAAALDDSQVTLRLFAMRDGLECWQPLAQNLDYTTGDPPVEPGFQAFTASGTFTVPIGVTAVEVLLVAGGGGGGSRQGGGGGAGGVRLVTVQVMPMASISVVVGGGGAGGLAGGRGANGANSAFDTEVAEGGGGGGGRNTDQIGSAGGSGGGGAGLNFDGGIGTPGQGESGGSSASNAYNAAGGGGGAGEAGAPGRDGDANETVVGGDGGAGVQISNLLSYGADGWFGGGGGGSAYAASNRGLGGVGGGGNSGSFDPASEPSAGQANTGGGGGGSGSDTVAGGEGGSGFVVVSWPPGRLVSAPTISALRALTVTV